MIRLVLLEVDDDGQMVAPERRRIPYGVKAYPLHYPLPVPEGRPRYVGMQGALPTGAERLLVTVPMDGITAGLLDELRRARPAVLAAIVPRLWLLAAPRPLSATTPNNWLRLWRAAGYTVEGVRTPLPPEPVRLYRGGRIPGGPGGADCGWSWCTSPVLAMAFASGFGYREGKALDPLWTALAPPDALLGTVPLGVAADGMTNAEEVVVYPPALTDVRPWTLDEIAQTPVPEAWEAGGAVHVASGFDWHSRATPLR